MKRDGETARRPDGEAARRGDVRVARGSMQRRLDELELVEIRPEPSAAERAAILIALEQMLGTPTRNEAPGPSPWALAGRRESLLGSGVSLRAGWGRGSDRLAGW